MSSAALSLWIPPWNKESQAGGGRLGHAVSDSWRGCSRGAAGRWSHNHAQRRGGAGQVRCDVSPSGSPGSYSAIASRRSVVGSAVAAAAALALLGPSGADSAHAVSTSRRALREKNIPEEEYTTLPSGLKVYDISVGSGRPVVIGDRVAVHYVVKWKGITFMTSRQGLGVTGGTPYGFDVGASDRGTVLKGLDLGVQGMRIGGERQMIVPPELAYGSKGVQEIPPNATLEINVQLLSIKQDVFGTPVKLVEG